MPVVEGRERRDEIDQPDLIAIVPFRERQTIDRLDHSTVELRDAFGIGSSPERKADRLVTVAEDIELLMDQRRHDEPFQITYRERVMEWRLSQQPGHLPQKMTDGRRRCRPFALGHLAIDHA